MAYLPHAREAFGEPGTRAITSLLDTVKLIDQRYTECFGARNAGPGCYGAYRAGARSLPAETMGYLAATAPMRTSGDRATPRSRRRSPAG
jgi:hypothetical protein